jgi:hypothetical protein
MKRTAAVLIGLTAYQVVGFTQDIETLERKPYHLKIVVDNTTFYEEELKASPFIYPDNTIQIYPGETVFIEVAIKNDAISKMTAVPAIKDSSKTMIITFSQETNKRVHQMMMLKIENPLSYQLNYKAMIYLMKHKKWMNTSTIPVMSKLVSYESWPDVITSIALQDWKLEKL